MKNNINEINGQEIIDFLNTISDDNDDFSQYNLCDISIVLKSFKFESQQIQNDKYSLSFTADFNNWGTNQEIHGNTLYITKNELWLSLEEPFEGTGTDETLEYILKEWIPNHSFTDQTELFYSKVRNVYEKLPDISFSDIKKMSNIITELIEAKSLMKE